MKKNPTKCVTKYCRRRRKNGTTRYCSKCISVKYYASNPGHQAFYRKRYHAKITGRDFTITRVDFLAIWYPGCSIDRINNTLGYIPGNCQAIVPRENVSKGNIERAPF